MKTLILALAALVLALAPAAYAGGVGFEELQIPDGADKPLTVGVWYPTDAPGVPTPLGAFVQTVSPGAEPAGQGLALVVMSHGTGGNYQGHYDTALALAHAGFVVAAVTHTGDNFRDESRSAMIWNRSEHIHRLIDYMLADWPHHGRIDPNRVGMFGFSAGGFTTLIVAGGVPDLTRVGPHCRAHPDYFDCGIVKHAGDIAKALANLSPTVWVHDPRVKAAVVAAPALGFTFGPEGLKDVRIPIQLWRDENDHILPNPDYAEAVRIALPSPPEFHLVPNADHFDFLAPCSDLMRQHAPDICVERPGFDRTAFHESFDAEVVKFFERTLR
jgi:predicted dienelactone hydrolase